MSSSLEPGQQARALVADLPLKASAQPWGTIELLEHILAFLPPASIKVSEKSCRRLRNVVKGSTKVRKASILSPIVHMNKFVEWQLLRGGESCLPRYDTPLALHPLIEHTSRNSHGLTFSMPLVRDYQPKSLSPASGPVLIKRMSESLSADAGKTSTLTEDGLKLVEDADTPNEGAVTLGNSLDHWATLPPCRVIGMQMCCWQSGRNDDWTHCMVYIPDGIRIKDLMAVAEALLRQDSGEPKHTRIEGRLAW
ncbi:hypothetical protein LTR09_000875 [Extremus antarcticus]|uniref:F-box domain-containing protein n=1 Tax=Extremus antarcticus TaxID=702011 RepID=A0AAJ0LW68_9PEZI|nr:hypothetical protein LTR09_000875 [Extremus antarcticus]